MSQMDKKDVAILTWHDHDNVGSNLQAYALVNYIKSLGYNCECLNYQTYTYENKCKRMLKLGLAFLPNHVKRIVPPRFRYDTLRFQRKYIPMSMIYTENTISESNDRYKCFICGSDQIWAPNVFNSNYMLSFVNDETPKFSYAASIGLNAIPDDLIPKYKLYLQRLNAISVREMAGVELLSKRVGVESINVVDPTFLISRSIWVSIGRHFPVQSDYVLCYFLSVNQEFARTAKELSRREKKKLVVISRHSIYKDCAETFFSNVSPDIFVDAVNRASYVLTDSFHGMAMSIILKRNFYVFDRFTENDPLCQNSRINGLLSILNLQDRKANGIINKQSPIDYHNCDELLEVETEKSKDYLNTILRRGTGH